MLAFFDWLDKIIEILIAPINNTFGTCLTANDVWPFVIIGLAFIYLTWKFLIKPSQENRKKEKLEKDLHPFYDNNYVTQHTKYYIPTKSQNVPPSHFDNLKPVHATVHKNLLIDFFLGNFEEESKDTRFYMLLAGSGMGKSTFMLNLYLQYVGQWKWWKKKYHIKLIPLGHSSALTEIEKLAKTENEVIRRRTILLLDAFDENTEAVQDYQKTIDEIINKVWDCRQIILTCRTQFFPNQEAENIELKVVKPNGGYHYFKKLYISPFDEQNTEQYLKKKFRGKEKYKRKKAKKVIDKSPKLMVRPMLLAYIDDLLNTDKDYQYSYEIYEELINKWITRESNKPAIISKEKNKFRDNLYLFSKTIAVHMYNNRLENKGLYLPTPAIKKFAKDFFIEIDATKLTGNSLLNRDRDGKWKFAHKSILEYFLAKEIFNNEKFAANFDFTGMEAVARFYEELFIFKSFIKKLNNVKLFIRYKPINIENLLLKDLKNLTELDLSNNQLTDINPIKQLKNLTELYLSNNQLTDINPIKELKNLTELDLSNNQLTDINPIKELKNLTELDLHNNQLTDINPIKQLKNLTTLSLYNNKITDINPIKQLKNLTELYLSNNQLTDINPIKELKNLTRLFLHNNQLTDINPIKELKNLTELYLSNNQLTDINPIKELKNLTRLFLYNNQLTDINPIKQLKNLTELYLFNNQLTDINPIKELKNLTSLSLDNNKITDINPIKQLKNLTTLSLYNNKITDINPIKQLKNLTFLYLYDNKVSKKQIKELKQALPNCIIRTKTQHRNV